MPTPDGSGGPTPDRAAQAAALRDFLAAGPERWPELAPAPIAAVGAERLRAIVEATAARVGGVQDVVDDPGGLAVLGPAGRVLAWARLDAEGRLADLRIAPARSGRREMPAGWQIQLARVFWLLLVGWLAAACWGVGQLTSWGGAVLSLGFGLLLFEGWNAPAAEPWWSRRPVEAVALLGLASAWRLPRLPVGDSWTELAVGAGLLGVAVIGLARARRHRWGAPAGEYHFPLRGSWYIVQGGGRSLNHHAGHPEQRGALDLVRTGSGGPRREPEHYPAYGEQVFAPCAGVVVAAVDGIEDQRPGTLRYAPAYGNHVFIETADGVLVKLAHLRPGSVRVTAGQAVAAGELLGEVGNSGNSTEPHLHLHAERAGLGLDLRFTGITGGLHRGRTVHGRTVGGHTVRG
ncbi:M23 family metallopeptidase [Kitasatospora sp. MMS16-BH015]|uniref:M23 family metallopeptidase n=1 Tax=Kitasatospora sp. MMS16-BH015 TaxID=2018025 RepID=UPI00131A5E6A|nr:M23 family metallopeptidase [Kitasatospora sp. MMS16-BH015]